MRRERRIAYFDCSSGISGDMILGALVDAGVDLGLLSSHLSGLSLPHELQEKTVQREGIRARRIEVIPLHRSGVLTYGEIKKVLEKSGCEEKVTRKSALVFQKLARAEATVHQKRLSSLTWSYPEAIDMVVDIVGSLVGLDLLGVEEVTASPLNLGSGQTNRGTLPIPAPATAEMIRGIPVYSNGIDQELVTPTGAAVITTIATRFGPLPPMTLLTIGSGAGSREIPGWPNLLRIFTGEPANLTGQEKIVIIETNIDDMSPQVYEYLIDHLFATGALDVFLTPVIMKKGRPGILVSVLSCPEKVTPLVDLLLTETTTLGVRLHEAERRTVFRKITRIRTGMGEIRVKIATRDGKELKISPEFQDCRRIAEKTGFPLHTIIEEVHHSLAQKRGQKRPKIQHDET